MTRIERAELDELFMEFGVDAAFPASKAFGITASLLFAYNLLGSNSSWSEDLTVMTTSRYIPIDFGIGVGISAVFRLD
jgi:hypothetical protein